MATKKEAELFVIRPVEIKTVPIRIVGDTPLIVHAWSEKAKRQMLETQMKVTKTKGKEIRNPVADFIGSLYWLEGKPEEDTEEAFNAAIENGAKFGFPVTAIKQAGNSAAYRLGWAKNQMELRGSYFLKAEYGSMAQIKGSTPIMREDMVRIGQGTADLRYRGEFSSWYMDLILEYNSSGNLRLEQILNVVNAGGFTVGIGEWRPERDGDNGRYHIETI